jgi:hypothetical protein
MEVLTAPIYRARIIAANVARFGYRINTGEVSEIGRGTGIQRSLAAPNQGSSFTHTRERDNHWLRCGRHACCKPGLQPFDECHRTRIVAAAVETKSKRREHRRPRKRRPRFFDYFAVGFAGARRPARYRPARDANEMLLTQVARLPDAWEYIRNGSRPA